MENNEKNTAKTPDIEIKNDGAAIVKPKKEEKKKGWWKSKTTGQKVSFIISIFILLISILAVFVYIYCRQLLGNEVGDALLGYYIYDGTKIYFRNGWEKIGYGMASSVIKWIGTFFILAITITLIFITNVLIRVFTSKKSRKSQTVGSLLKSLSKYIYIILAIALILVLWGVDVAGIIAGVGVLTLVIGLGCQSLIQDIVSGLFIVFDDYFAVGDIVIIDGFRGTITEVGLKTTKILDPGGNIKAISNSQISTVTNLSRMDSMVLVNIGCAYEEDIERVEALIIEEIPQIAKRVPHITSGLEYKGIDNIGASSIDFLVLCFCKEADRYQVTRDLKRELALLFRRNDVIIPYTQITVSKENDHNRPKASDAQKLIALKANNNLRGVGKTEEVKTKKGLFRKIRKAVKEEAEEADEDR